MGLLAISCPNLAADDQKWIEGIRRRYDPLSKLVAPHFTLVFETPNINQDKFISHIRNKCECASPINFQIRQSRMVFGIDESWYLFLTPEDGYRRIIKLHDDLYQGILADHLRLDIPYIPHITIGRFREKSACGKAADKINHPEINITGSISEIDVVYLRKGKLDLIDKIPLKT